MSEAFSKSDELEQQERKMKELYGENIRPKKKKIQKKVK